MRKNILTISIILAVVLMFGITSIILAGPPKQAPDVEVAIKEEVTIAATVSSRISYQGYLTDKNTGNPLNGLYNMVFQFWDAATNGSQVGSDVTVSNVAVEKGLFNVEVDVPQDTFNGQGIWIRVKVGDEWLDPRKEILPVPYAMSLVPGASVQGATGLYDAVFSVKNIDTLTTTYGISSGSYSPYGAGITAWNSADNGGMAIAGYVDGNNALGNSIAIYGYASAISGTTRGVYGEVASPDGWAIHGSSPAITGTGRGVYGKSASPNGVGVYGYNSAVGGTAVQAVSVGTGIFAESSASDGMGIVGFASSTTGSTTGVQGIIDSASGGSGVGGVSRASTGDGRGVFGDSNSPDGSGVYGHNDDGGNGILGTTDNGTGSGVHGASYAASGCGVSGVNYATSGWGIGVYGETSSDGPAIAAYNSGTGFGLSTRSVSGTLIIAYGNNASDPEFYVSNDGNVYADGTYQSPAADFAEMLPAHNGLESGDVLIIGADGQLTLSVEPYQTSVIGVYSTDPGFLGGVTEDTDATNNVPLAIVGIVPVKVSSENGPIQPGDLLTTSSSPGYAMVCHNRLDCIGSIVGKALEPLEEGTGIIQVLVTLQ